MLLQFEVGSIGNRSDNGRAQIDWDAIGFLMVESLHDPVARFHLLIILLMNSLQDSHDIVIG